MLYSLSVCMQRRSIADREEGRVGGQEEGKEDVRWKGCENLRRYRGRMVRHCNGWIEGKNRRGRRAGREAKGMEQELTEEGYTDTVCGDCVLLQMNTASLAILTFNTVVCWFTRALASISTRTTST